MSALDFLERSLVPAPLEARGFANFGEPLGEGGRMRLDLPPVAGPFLAVQEPGEARFPHVIEGLERRREASKVILPLGPHRFVIVVAPGLEAPEWANIRAFLTAPGQGLGLRRGCWHLGPLALGSGARFAVLDGSGEGASEMAAPFAIRLLRPV